MHELNLSLTSLRIGLDRARLKNLTRPAPLRLLARTGVEWACIITLAALASHVSNVGASLACMLLIATRQHALLALMHEYVHYQFSRKHGWLNDLLGDVFTAFPFFITVHGFRRNHMPHHRHAATDQDPNWLATIKKERYHFPKTRHQIYIEIVKHCLGWYTLQDLKSYTVDAGMALDLPFATRVARVIFFVLLLGATTWLGVWPQVLLYWLLPLATFLMAILYLRDMGEHYGMPAPGIGAARTVLAGWWERVVIAPHGVNFHAEHHLYPSVPYFRLKDLHQELLTHATYRKHAVITHGYLAGLLDEVSAVPANWKAA